MTYFFNVGYEDGVIHARKLLRGLKDKLSMET